MAYAWEEERPELAEVIRQLEEENEHTRAGYLSAPLAERRAQLSKKLNDQGA